MQCRQCKEIQTYWCTLRYRSEIPLNQQVIIGSVKGYRLFYRSRFVAYTHSLSTDIAPVANKIPLLFPFVIDLGHGIDGLKKRLSTARATGYDADLYTCVSSKEFSIKNKEWGISESKIAITGMARYDSLPISHQKKKVRTILYIPTWRDWDYEKSQDEFEKCDTFLQIKQLCTDRTLSQFLGKYGITLTIRLHPFFDKFSKSINSINALPNIEYVNKDISVLVKQADMFITDYSSICWDFLYSLKPVIFFQYDQNLYIQERGAYIDFDSDLFGPVVFTEHELVDKLQTQIFTINQNELFELRSKYFRYVDGKNSERIFNEAMSRTHC